MKFPKETKNSFIIGTPHQAKPNEHSLIVNNDDTQCLIKVLACPPHAQCSVGDVVWYNKDYGSKYKLANTEYVVIGDDDIITILEDED